jgi:hypothetical protein
MAILHRRALLGVLEQLLREGIVAYTPVASGEGVDAAVRLEDGAYRDLVVRASPDEHRPLWFQVEDLTPRDNLVVLCYAWQVSPPQLWVFPSRDYARYAESAGAVLTLDLEAIAPDGSGRLKQTLSRYRNAWRLVTGGALKPFAP